MIVPDVFKPFIDTTRTAFDYLVTTYGFERRTEQAIGPEAWIVFESPATRITVHYELGAAPCVEIGQLEDLDGRLVQTKEVGLDLLARERSKALTDDVEPPRDLSSTELSAMLQVRARLLAEVGDDLLRGDYQSFPRLQSKAEKELRRREAEIFGSSKQASATVRQAADQEARMTAWKVVISGDGRAGTMTYGEGDNRIRFDWEIGGRDVVAIITGPPPQNWDSELAWASGRRREILGRVAQEAIRSMAPTSYAELTDGETTILLKKQTQAG
jgi:hypothetical protein